MRYVLYGDMLVWSYNDPNDAGVAMRTGEDFFIFQPAGSIWGYGDGPVSEQGAVWLEVTYSEGVSHGGGPLEQPTTIE